MNVQQSVKNLLKRVNDDTDINANRIAPSIYMAPCILRDLSPSSFEPRVVSIGPLHRDHKNVQAFEGQKVRFVHNLLCRTGVPKEETLDLCFRKVKNSMKQIKGCYSWTKVFEDSEIADMMVIDACFILEFIYWYSGYDESYSKEKLLSQTIIYDLVLLENQIPFFVLDQIYDCTILKNHYVSLTTYIRPIIDNLNLFMGDIKNDRISNNITTPHILSLLHEYYKPPSDIKSADFSSRKHLAVHLDRAGLKFKPNKDPEWDMQIEVKINTLSCCIGSWRKPIVKLPVLYVHDFTEVILRNLIAYEQSCQSFSYITSYAYAMNMLVHTQEDVTKLVDSQVLVHDMSSNEEAADMINSICKNVICQDFFYSQQYETLTTYCNAYWSKNIFKLKRTYFSSPWSIIALFAGIILFALTVIQTIFSIKSA